MSTLIESGDETLFKLRVTVRASDATRWQQFRQRIECYDLTLPSYVKIDGENEAEPSKIRWRYVTMKWNPKYIHPQVAVLHFQALSVLNEKLIDAIVANHLEYLVEDLLPDDEEESNIISKVTWTISKVFSGGVLGGAVDSGVD